jgi:hypothetical protein
MSIRLGSSWPETIYWAIALAMLAAAAITLILMIADTRTLNGHMSVWTKPLKFELSLALHASTIALVCGLFSPPAKNNVLMLLIALLFLAACIIEMGYILIQGGLGQQSHFNVGTPFHRFMYSVMAAAAVIIVGAAAAIGLMTMADSDFSASPTLKSAIVLGLVGGTGLTLITAFTIGGRMSPFVGGVPDFGSRMVLTGWSQTGGDLRVSHFLATHMIQVIPFAALLVDRVISGRGAVLAVFALASLWVLFTMSEYRTALSSKSSILTSFFR